MKNFRKFVIFCFVGFCSFLIDWTFFNIFYKISSWFIFSIVIATVISMIFNFIMNRNFTFKARGYSIKKQIPRWLVVYFITLLSRIISGKCIIIVLGENLLNANIAYFVGIALAIPISFLGSLLWAFKKD